MTVRSERILLIGMAEAWQALPNLTEEKKSNKQIDRSLNIDIQNASIKIDMKRRAALRDAACRTDDNKNR